MSQPPSDDRDLREAFGRLRDADASRTPEAAILLARARAQAQARSEADRPDAPDFESARRRRAWRRGLRWGVPGVSVALAAGLAAVLLVRGGGDEDAAFDEAVQAWAETGGSWRSPTDDLLRMPGDELLRTVPRIGGTRPSTPREPDAPSRSPS